MFSGDPLAAQLAALLHLPRNQPDAGRGGAGLPGHADRDRRRAAAGGLVDRGPDELARPPAALPRQRRQRRRPRPSGRPADGCRIRCVAIRLSRLRLQQRQAERGGHVLRCAALVCLLNQPGVDPGRVFYLGESIGGAVALDLALERPPAGLVLLSAFASVRDLGRLHYPFVPAALIPTPTRPCAASESWRLRSWFFTATAMTSSALAGQGPVRGRARI
jgi:pimeloyl-ACP methyl ester carboxylesterase